MLDSSEILRSNFLSKKFKEILNKKEITIQEVADKMWNSHAYISWNLSGKKVPSDNFYKKVAKVILLTDNEIKEIFKKADQEAYKHKYWEDLINLPSEIDLINVLENLDLEDFIISLSKKEWTTDEQVLKEIKEFAKFKIEQWDTEFLKKLVNKKKK